MDSILKRNGTNMTQMLSDFEMPMDHVIEVEGLYMIVTEQKNNICKIIDISMPNDSWLDLKGKRKK